MEQWIETQIQDAFDSLADGGLNCTTVLTGFEDRRKLVLTVERNDTGVKIILTIGHAGTRMDQKAAMDFLLHHKG